MMRMKIRKKKVEADPKLEEAFYKTNMDLIGDMAPTATKEPYDIEKNMLCWRCSHANIQKGREYYGITDGSLPKRPACNMWQKSFYANDWDIPDPMELINEHGCKFDDLHFDLRDLEGIDYA